VVDHQFTKRIFDGLKVNVRKVLGDSVKLDYRLVDKLETTPTGKFRVAIS
jgi:hypothetical protein